MQGSGLSDTVGTMKLIQTDTLAVSRATEVDIGIGITSRARGEISSCCNTQELGHVIRCAIVRIEAIEDTLWRSREHMYHAFPKEERESMAVNPVMMGAEKKKSSVRVVSNARCGASLAAENNRSNENKNNKHQEEEE